MVKIAPSILSADFSKLGQEINEVEKAGADYIHVDVMDGQFVPNITIGPLVVEAIRPITSLPLDVHLMIEKPDSYIKDFVEAGADIITIHVEATKHLHRTLELIRASNVKCGVVLNPATPVSSVKHVLHMIDMVLVMTVNPGFGGQSFIHEAAEKIKELADFKIENKLEFEIEVDGGVNKDTAKICADYGADVLVSGSAIFNKDNRKEAIKEIREAIK